MKNKYVLLVVTLLLSISSFAQQEKMTREEKDEKNEAKVTRVKDKTDYALFHRQMLSLKEYNDERRKIPNLQKVNKMTVKVVPVIDSLDDADDAAKTLIGYIRQDIGDNSTNVYEVIFDRTQKKIVAVKHTTEAIDADKDAAADKAEKATTKKTEVKKTTVKKKKGDDDDDDDADDDAPAKNKKDKDDE